MPKSLTQNQLSLPELKAMVVHNASKLKPEQVFAFLGGMAGDMDWFPPPLAWYNGKRTIEAVVNTAFELLQDPAWLEARLPTVCVMIPKYVRKGPWTTAILINFAVFDAIETVAGLMHDVQVPMPEPLVVNQHLEEPIKDAPVPTKAQTVAALTPPLLLPKQPAFEDEAGSTPTPANILQVVAMHKEEQELAEWVKEHPDPTRPPEAPPTPEAEAVAKQGAAPQGIPARWDAPPPEKPTATGETLEVIKAKHERKAVLARALKAKAKGE